MTLQWIKEHNAHWDTDKQRIVGAAPVGIFDRRYSSLRVGEAIPGEWWRVDDGGITVGYGWLDIVWGDAEILLAADPAAQRRGVGGFILEQLENESRARSLRYIYNVVRPTHPDAVTVSAWLERRGFTRSVDGNLVRVVRAPRS